ncbi:FAD-dependent oxidoreductase [Leptolyngbya sp. CCNP1308]|uniref:NAD(P)/FAD-dependent oxidoreductase n=1 Tax=Leptolyngbya sp. CCNP1308 TaxID=3110255 RepID=UPI002B1F3EF4|nr:FAD-dependent oxidoreductase [Leptolyngbya sp. CCNP1308]MEA5448026.1 FAD-dependent oxidoreductase [Leptolyngbya sp. CCNP1308]
MAHVVVIGAGLGGLPTAYELRKLLPSQHQVTLISDQPKFTFIPGLARVGLAIDPLDHFQLDLEPLAQRHNVALVKSKVTALDPHARRITLDIGETIDYDYGAIATGPSFAFDAIPGLGPHDGYTHSICAPSHALEARDAWLQFLENPGSLVVGAAPGVGCFGPAYEFILMAEQILRKRGLGDRATLTLVTPEPYVGHLGISGVKNAQKLTVALLRKRGVEVIANAAITAIAPDSITLDDGRILPQQYAMILPAFRGASFIQNTPGLGNQKGFIPVLPTYQHSDFPSVYALGVGVSLSQPEQFRVPIGLPKSGQMTEAMGMAVAHNIAVQLGAIQKPLQTPTLEAICFAEFGETGILYVAAPVLPDPATGKRRYSYAVQGKWVVWGKALFEQYFMTKMRLGAAVPWYERLGLRAIFGVDLVKPIAASPQETPASA